MVAGETVAKRPLLLNEDVGEQYTDNDEDEEVFIQLPSKVDTKTTKTVKLITTFCALGQFLFGYDTGVVSGSMLFIRKEFGVGDLWQEIIVSATIIAAAVFAMLGGPITDKIGRRMTAVGSGILFALGSVVLCTAKSPLILVVGRTIVGCGLGLTSMCLPMYISECAPAKRRGRLLLISCTFGCSGMFVANLVDGIFSYDNINGWRYMLGIPALPALVMAAGIAMLPESPRWLMKTGQTELARQVLYKLRPAQEVETELCAIRRIVDEENAKKIEAGRFVLVRMLRHSATRRALMLGCGLQMFQQLAAINTVMYYTATIMKMAGIYNDHTAIWLSACVSGINVLFTVVGMMLVDRIGRRKLILGSYTGVIFSLVILAVGFQLAVIQSPRVSPRFTNSTCNQYSLCQNCIDDTGCGFCFHGDAWSAVNGSCLPVLGGSEAYRFSAQGACASMEKSPAIPESVWAYGFCPTAYYWVPVLGMAFYLISFAPGLASVPWIVNTEIYPIWARSTGNGIATATNWTFNVVVSMSFLSLVSVLGKHGAFWLYTSFSLVGIAFVAVFLPETKGKKLEELEQLFIRTKT